MEFELSAYLARIGLQEAPPVSVEGLRTVHRAHIMQVPFENLDVFSGRPVVVSEAGVFEKIVNRKCGGYCFEMNACLAAGLRHLGFEVRGVLARVARGPMGFGGYSHRVNLITLPEGLYVADVGFGGESFTEPLAVRPGEIQQANGLRYRVMPGDTVDYAIQIEQDGAFTDMLGFNLAACLEEDFEIGNFYTSSSPVSPFRSHIMCALPHEGGRATLFDRWLTLREGTHSETRVLEGDALPRALEEIFSLRPEEPALEKMAALPTSF